MNQCIDSNESVCTSSVDCTERLQATGVTGTVELVRNYSLDKIHCAVTRAIIVVHGRDRNPGDYFNYILDASVASSKASETLVISPYFREQTDARQDSDLYWDRTTGSASQYDWAMGGESVAP